VIVLCSCIVVAFQKGTIGNFNFYSYYHIYVHITLPFTKSKIQEIAALFIVKALE